MPQFPTNKQTTTRHSSYQYEQVLENYIQSGSPQSSLKKLSDKRQEFNYMAKYEEEDKARQALI